MPAFIDTIAALATPVGTAALAVVRVSGPRSAALATEIFKRTPLPRHVSHADYRDRAGELVDETLFTFFQAPRSYTGEDGLEISCHGNPFIAQKILEDLFARGCRPAGPGEFTERAFLNGRMDLSQAEAVMDLIHARSERALAVAHQQLRGALGRHMQELIDALLGLLARVEAQIDFPEEDLPPEDRNLVARGLEKISQSTDRLLATSHYGEMLRTGVKTVILGLPNAGKSSLLNRLLGRERALVSAEPGTTRDFLEEPVAMGPHCIRLIDTAGLNPAPAALERLGIDKTLERAAEADLFLWVLDATAPCPVLPAALAARLTPANTLAVANKIDLTSPRPLSPPAGLEVVRVSALTGAGLDELRSAIAAKAETFCTGIGEDTIAINARHAHSLNQAKDCLTAAQAKLAANEATELLASDLRGALNAFGEISGKVDNERMLDQLFAMFCIGK
ncbi:MAG TPA: tRNA uridine-5-carboxymethylaminomethyl(34) synthesis GTPase MnmE [Opitutaceae bacterium]|jgi:tRNA modification GTPase|nr:tRNA uridine-5-carboxymethylaminomethyl(34) synthesis GTPase MnmE [Opitutaceae bacterium]